MFTLPVGRRSVCPHPDVTDGPTYPLLGFAKFSTFEKPEMTGLHTCQKTGMANPIKRIQGKYIPFVVLHGMHEKKTI